VTADEILYLCSAASRYFREPVEPSKVIWNFAGVRPLLDDGSDSADDVTRDFTIDMEGKKNEAPLISVLGGKLTTYRRLAEAVLAKLETHFVMRERWTANEPLPGGDLGPRGVAGLTAEILERHPYVEELLARRLASSYGTRAWKIVAPTSKAPDLGMRLVGNLHEAELEYLRDEEWARTPEDVLWRRTKLGLIAGPAEMASLKAALGVAAAEAS
jgi:glycerol-3-phosphate dehydrogenase